MARSIRSYRREIRALRAMLAAVQWVQPTYNGSPSCSGCGVQKHQHNDAVCGLSLLLVRKGARRA